MRLFALAILFFISPELFSQSGLFANYFIQNDSLKEYLLDNPYERINSNRTIKCPEVENGDLNCYTGDNLMMSTRMKKGNIHGTYQVFHKNGKINVEAKYYMGRIIGEAQYYHSNGKLQAVIEYFEGRIRNIIEMYDNRGQPLNFGDFANANGTINFYRPDGNLLRTARFEHGFLNGLCTYYYSNGNKMAEGLFEGNKLTGEWLEYDIEGNVIQKSTFKLGKLIKTEIVAVK